MLVPSHWTVRCEVLAEEALDAVGVADRRVEEGDPALVPTQHHIVPLRMPSGGRGRAPAGRWRRWRAARARASACGSCARRGRADRSRADAAPERLRRDVDAAACEAAALPLDGLVLEVLVADRLDDERVAELAALDDLRRRLGRHDGVVVRAGDALVETLLDEERAGRTLRISHARGRRSSSREPHSGQMRCSGGTGLNTATRLQVRRRRGAPRVLPLRLFLGLSRPDLGRLRLLRLGTRPSSGNRSWLEDARAISDAGARDGDARAAWPARC